MEEEKSFQRGQDQVKSNVLAASRYDNLQL